MTLEQLRHFAAAAETCNYSRAAERLFVSHSTISRSVSALEEELGVPLLLRTSRSITCTAPGIALLEGANRILALTEEVRSQVVSRGRGQPERLRIASVNFYFPPLYEFYHRLGKEYPQIALEFTQLTPIRISDALLAGKCDVGLTFSYSLPPHEDIVTFPLAEGRFCVIASRLHPLAQRSFLTREEAERLEGLYGMEESQRFRLPQPGEPPLSREVAMFREDHLSSMLLQVKAGTCVAVVPEHAAAEFGQGCVQIPIVGEQVGYQIVLSYHKYNRNPALRCFLALMQEGALRDVKQKETK